MMNRNSDSEEVSTDISHITACESLGKAEMTQGPPA